MSDNAFNTIQAMRNIINDLRQTEFQNATIADNWAHEELKEASDLNNNIGNVPEMARHDQQLAEVLHQINHSENKAVQQLDNLTRMLIELENQLR